MMFWAVSYLQGNRIGAHKVLTLAVFLTLVGCGGGIIWPMFKVS